MSVYRSKAAVAKISAQFRIDDSRVRKQGAQQETDFDVFGELSEIGPLAVGIFTVKQKFSVKQRI